MGPDSSGHLGDDLGTRLAVRAVRKKCLRGIQLTGAGFAACVSWLTGWPCRRRGVLPRFAAFCPPPRVLVSLSMGRAGGFLSPPVSRRRRAVSPPFHEQQP